MEQPTLEESVALLTSVNGLDDIDPDTPLQHTDVDSLHLVEWLYALQDRHPTLRVDESLLDGMDDTVSFRALHERLLIAQAGDAVALAEASGPVTP